MDEASWNVCELSKKSSNHPWLGDLVDLKLDMTIWLILLLARKEEINHSVGNAFALTRTYFYLMIHLRQLYSKVSSYIFSPIPSVSVYSVHDTFINHWFASDRAADIMDTLRKVKRKKGNRKDYMTRWVWFSSSINSWRWKFQSNLAWFPIDY